jgi:UDP-N-acetylmuramoyl-tripeptide--D-alanyl-D-alanine ligase
MGANHQGEIASYCRYALPTYGLITNCGKAHLEGFGGVEGVRKGKGELFDHLRKNQGTAFVMWDYDYLKEMSAGIPNVITYGTHAAAVEGTLLKSEPFLELRISHGTTIDSIKTRLVGAYNLPNVLAAVAIGTHFNVPAEKIKAAIENYAPSNSRSQLIQKGNNTIILDAYNANPSSMKLAIENFATLPEKKKVLMLGAMAELGTESLAEHQSIIELISRYTWYKVVLVGGDFLSAANPYLSFPDAAAAKEWLAQQNLEHTHLLIKGSRSMQMEKVLPD